jgi:hypothetical protein
MAANAGKRTQIDLSLVESEASKPALVAREGEERPVPSPVSAVSVK